ncbi:MAG: adenylate/guanylate cyclase domain-containing protein [Pseudomonadota bacterium]
MSDVTAPHTPGRWIWFSGLIDRESPVLEGNPHLARALQRHKQEGMWLAVRARVLAMVAIAIMVMVVTPWPQAIYYLGISVLFVLIGVAQYRVGRIGTSRAELALLFCDLVLMTITVALPNPLETREIPLAFQLQFDGHKFFFILLAMATLSYSWRTIVAVGTWTTVLWILTIGVIWYLSEPDPEITATLAAMYPDADVIAALSNPTLVSYEQHVQELVAFMVCALILAVSMRRFTHLVLGQAEVERERANLARYFSPNVVDQLSHNDEPLKKVSTQDIAVMFVDIVGFTQYSAARDPREVIGTLREFHALMEAEIFRHSGTLDKYLGDGLMATFGTPVAGPDDAANALACTRAMLDAVDRWNAGRVRAGEQEIRASIGVHYGSAVLGDVGANRLEFAVLGNTVNVASRLEAMTRALGVRAIVSSALLEQVETSGEMSADLKAEGPQSVRGLDQPLEVWSLG